MNELKKGDLVTPVGGDKIYRIASIINVFGVMAADLIIVRKKDGQEGVKRGRNYKNLPVSCLKKVI